MEKFSLRDWGVLLRSVIGVAVSVVPVALISLGAFVKPLNTAFGWDRGEISLAITVMALSMAAAMPVAGALIDRFGIYKPTLLSLVAYAIGLLAIPTAAKFFGISGLLVCAAWIGATGSASSSISYVKMLSARFDRSRGLALGIAMSGMSLGAAVAPFFAVSFIVKFGWEAGFHGLALLPVLVGMPIAWSLRGPMAQSRGAGASLTAGAGQTAGAGMTLRDVLRSRIFLSLFALFLLAAAALHGIQLHLPALLSDLGMTPKLSVAAVSAMFVISLIMRIVAGYLFDRMFAPWVGAVCFLGSAIGAALLIAVAGAPLGAGVAIALFAIGTGAESDLLALLVSRYFGPQAFARIYGGVFAAFMIGSAFGPFLVGSSFDAVGNYGVALACSAFGLLIAAALLATLPRFSNNGADAG